VRTAIPPRDSATPNYNTFVATLYPGDASLYNIRMICAFLDIKFWLNPNESMSKCPNEVT